MDQTRRSVEKVFALFEKHGDSNYLGEVVSKTEHSVQCAMLAEKDTQKSEVILGALFHDIGHLVGMEKGLDRMITDGVDLGAKDHDVVGERYLQEHGFPASITDFVRGHVQAKRYLVYKKPEYYKGLSDASKKTLIHQGGPMTREEAERFEIQPAFESILKMRTWDEQAKDPDCVTKSISEYKDMCNEYLSSKVH